MNAMATTKGKKAATERVPVKKKAATKKKTDVKAAPVGKQAPKAKPTAKAKASSPPNPDDTAAFAPGSLVKHDDEYSLVYSSFPHVAAFDKHGIEGGGYTWQGLVEHILNEDDPEALDALDFDPEASMFCAVSKDLGALQAVGRALKKLEDPVLLTELAGTVDLSEYD